MALDQADLQTETFTNSQGWTVVRVTHVPSGLFAERERTKDRESPVGAQAECVDELERRLEDGSTAEPASDEPVRRDEFAALVARVDALERRLSERA